MREGRGAWAVLVLAAAVLVPACAPALNWREWRMPGTALVALLPCKPQRAERDVPVAGRMLRVTLAQCDAAGATWALMHADTGDPAQVGPALVELRAAALRNLGADSAADDRAAQVTGMTPNAAARLLRASGRRPDGAAVQAAVAVFAHGTSVWQATVLAPQLDDEAQATFIGALRVAPP